MRILRVKNYEKYQNHRAKDPRWIKLYRSLLTDRDFLKLDIDSRYIFVGLLILASESGNSIVNDPPYLAHRLSIDVSRLDLTALFRSGLLVASSSTLRRMIVPQRREETETEKISPLPPLGGKRARGKTALPQELVLTAEEQMGWDKFGINSAIEFAAFKDHARTEDRRCSDWEAAKRNWMRKAIRIKEERRGMLQVR